MMKKALTVWGSFNDGEKLILMALIAILVSILLKP